MTGVLVSSNFRMLRYDPRVRSYTPYAVVYSPRVQPYVACLPRVISPVTKPGTPQRKPSEETVSEFLATGQFILGGEAVLALRVAAIKAAQLRSTTVRERKPRIKILLAHISSFLNWLFRRKAVS